MDDTFMAKFFENNIQDTEYLLHLILENDKIRVEKVIGQYSIANLQGHSSRLDMMNMAIISMWRCSAPIQGQYLSELVTMLAWLM